MDDRRAALLLACLALAGAGVRHFLSPSPSSPPGDVQLQSSSTPRENALRETARRAAQLSRPLLPGERIDVDRADVSEITRLPRVGPALAQRIVAWRTEHGPFGSLSRLDSETARCHPAVRVFFGGSGHKTLTGLAPKHILGLQFQ